MTFYVKQAKMLFVHTPKTGGISIKSWIKKNFDDPLTVDRIHSTYYDTIDKVPEDTFSFSVCRNPWDRKVSYYFFLLKSVKERIDIIKNNKAPKPHKLKWNLNYLEKQKDQLEVGFNHFIKNKNLWSESVVATNSLQTKIIGDCDIVLRFENLTEDFKQIQKILNCYTPLGHENKTIHKHYKEYYNQESIDIVAEYFQVDIKKYNYSY